MSSLSVSGHSAASLTEYSGVTFRSRLEARWALFFDLMGWDWDFEPAKFYLPGKATYIPDFYLYGPQLWVEVKGAPFLKERSLTKMALAVSGANPIPMRSAPYTTAARILILGNVVQSMEDSTPVHFLLERREFGVANMSHVSLTDSGVAPVGEPYGWWDANGSLTNEDLSDEFSRMVCDPGVAEVPQGVKVMHALTLASMEFPRGRKLVLPPELKWLEDSRYAGRPTV